MPARANPVRPALSLERLSARLTVLETALKGLLLAPAAVLGGFTTTGGFPVGQSSKLKLPLNENCEVEVSTDVAYELIATRTQGDKVCRTYRITTTVTMVKVCSPGGEVERKVSTHISEKEFCGDESDHPPKGGRTSKANGETVITLGFPHGTKIKVTKSGGKITVEITYPDGTTDTVVFE